jgi:filamentous hemagglutinin family protein
MHVGLQENDKCLTTSEPERISAFKRFVLWITLIAFVLQPMAATAQIISATTGSKGPEVGTAQNGITVVQIRAPSAAGVSHNQYDIYSTTAQGVVLNNSPIVVQSQLAGFIEGNAHLAGGPARLILNEVVGPQASDLRGFTEVAGQAAEVIIANPNGITCNGCGFINTTRGVLTTGTPVFGAGGSLDALRVTGGQINLSGTGLNGSNTAQIDLIARAVKINAEFWGQKLNVIAGANQVNHGDLSTQTITGSGPALVVAIDVAALGGMYANTIRLVGTEAGVGVVSDGTLAAQAGDMTIDSAGYLTVNGTTQARGRLELRAQQDLTNNGTLYAQGDAQLVSQAQISNSGTLAAQGDLTLEAERIASSGLLAAGMAADGSFGSQGDLTLAARDTVSVHGTQAAGRNIDVSGRALDLSGSQSRSNGNITLTATAGDIDHRQADLQALGDVSLSASGTIDNRDGTLQSAGALSLTTGSSYTHSADSTLRGDRAMRLASGGDLTLAADLSTPGQLQLVAGGTLTNHATQDGQNVDLRAAHLDNNGVIAADNDLTATVDGRLRNRSNKLILAGRDQRLLADELINEEDGTLYAGRDLVIQKDATGTAARQVTNQIGRIEAGNDLIIRSDALLNQGRTPTILTRTTGDAIPGVLTACPGPNPSSPLDGCNSSGSVSAAGETIWYSDWGFRVSTPSEVRAYFARNPEAPTSDPYSRNFAPTFLELLSANRGDRHEREDGWEVGMTRSAQYLAPDAVIKGAQLLAGRDVVFAGGTLDNVGSLIDANRDVSLTGSTLTNQGQSLQTTTVYHSASYTLSAGRHQLNTPYITTTDIQTTGAVPSSITAGGTLRGNLSERLTNDNRARPATVAPDMPAHANAGPLLVPAAGSIGLTSAAPPSATYLIETNPRYAHRGNFISSDYFLKRLGLDPQTVEKRLGDAAWEQARVRDQLFALSGRRFLNDSRSEMAQYQRLMDNAYAARQAFDFKIGVALTPEQIAQLTSDIVWLVEQDAVLADGRTQKVLVPQVYLSRLTRNDLTPDGALIAANEIELVAPDLANRGLLRAGRRIDIAALDLTNSGTIASSMTDGTTALTAVNDLTNIGGTIAGNTVDMAAGRDLINRADSFERTTDVDGGLLSETVVGAAGRIVAGGKATLSAGRDIVFAGGELDAGGPARLQAKDNLSIGTAVRTSRLAITGSRGYSYDGTQVEHRGSRLKAGDSLTMVAGQDIELIASTAKAGTALSAEAGGALTIGTATDQDSYRIDSNQGVDHVESDSRRAQGSTLDAGTDLKLTSGRAMTLEAATVRAGEDSRLSSGGDLSIVAGRSTQSMQQQHTDVKNSDSVSRYEETVQGSVITAGRDLQVSAGTSAAPTAPAAAVTIEGSALAAGQALTVEATGDLALLAASSQRQEVIQRMAMRKKTLETLSFELEQNRVLLSTLTAGSRLDLTVGGNLAAQTGTTDADGALQADRMTANGVVKGGERQQVSLTHTDDKAGSTLNGPTSKVLGDLAAQGIRSGATDNLSPEAIQTGQAAVTALINSGLLTVKNQPAVQAALNAPTPNGAALTYTDTTGTVSLTLAGQAKVQAVYSQLTLTETFDVTHFPDQQTAQIVTLVAAVVLTICTAGAGAALVGAVQGTMAAAMANAAFIGMMSTMVGQLAGGASFDQAFQAGVKAGATSAITAGVSYGVSDAMGMYAHDTSGNVILENGAPKLSTAGDSYAKLSTLNKLGDSRFWTMAAANTTASGIASTIHGGTFADGLKGGAIGVAGSTLNTAVGDWGVQNGLAPGDLSKVALHASIGAAQAKLSGRDPLAGAIGAAAAEALSPLANALDKSTGNRAAGELTTSLGGLAANALLNKDNPFDMTAAYQALQTDRFNRRLHGDEPQLLARLKEGKSAKEQHRFDAAACANVESASGVRKDDPLYADRMALQHEGEAYTDERKALRDTGQFNYPPVDKLTDWRTRNDEAVTRFKGGVNALGGATGVVGGGAITAGGLLSCPATGVGCLAIPAGLAITGVSNQQLHEGTTQALGPYQSTEGQGVVDSFDPNYSGRLNPLAKDAIDLMGVAAQTLLAKGLVKLADGPNPTISGGAGAKEVATIIEPKIAQQLGTRGWSVDAIESVITSPAKTVVTRDTRFNPVTGTRLNDPATGYISQDGAYIVRNDRTGQVVQVSNKNDPTWKAPWDK